MDDLGELGAVLQYVLFHHESRLDQVRRAAKDRSSTPQAGRPASGATSQAPAGLPHSVVPWLAVTLTASCLLSTAAGDRQLGGRTDVDQDATCRHAGPVVQVVPTGGKVFYLKPLGPMDVADTRHQQRQLCPRW